MINEILDYDRPVKPFYKYRSLALILEFAFLFMGVSGIVFMIPELTTIGFLTGAIIYPLFAWYLFKTNTYHILDILFATFFGLGIFVVLVSLLFYFQQWEGAKEMVIAAHLTLMVGTGLSLAHYLIRIMIVKNKEQEFRMSLKLFSRYLFLLILFYALNLDEFTETILIEI